LALTEERKPIAKSESGMATPPTPSGQKPDTVDQKDWDELSSQLSKVCTSNLTAEDIQSADPSKLGNDPNVELIWAEKAFKHAETYYKVLTVTKDKKKMRLTKIDDDIYGHFRRVFETLDVKVVDEAKLKSESEKSKWRGFCNNYERHPDIKDFNYGTLLRASSRGDVSPDNTIIVPRIQFLAIEIARNREGANDTVVAAASDARPAAPALTKDS